MALERVPAAGDDRFGPVTAVDGLLAADSLGDEAAAQFAPPRPASREIVQQQPLPLASLGDRGVGAADALAVLLDFGQCLLAPGCQHPAPAEQVREPLFGRLEIALSPFGALAAGLEPFGDLLERGAGALDQFLATLDDGEQFRLALVGADGLFRAGVDRLPAGGEFRVAAREFRQQVGFAIRFLLELRGQVVQVRMEQGPAFLEHGL